MKDLENLFAGYRPSAAPSPDPDRQFDQLEASVLFCPQCQQAVPVRKRLLLALPEGDKYDYLCVYCGNSAGTKTEQNQNPVQLIIR